MDTCRSRADDADIFILEVDAVVPVGRVNYRAVEVVQPVNIGPHPVVKDTCSIYENVTKVSPALLGGLVFECKIPDTTLLVPAALNNLCVDLDILGRAKSLDTIIKVLADFGAVGIVVGPVRLWVPGECVKVGWDLFKSAVSFMY